VPSCSEDNIKNIQALDELIDTISKKIKKAEDKLRSFMHYTEKAHRRALKELMNVPSLNLLFRRTHQLHVMEPKEPGSVRWLDLADSKIL